MLHTIHIKVRGYHLDVYGHVNNARHLEFLEEARWALLESRVDLEAFMKKGFLFVVVNININYRHPALLHNVLRIESALKTLNRHSAILRQTTRLKGTDKIITDAEITFVILDAATQKPLRLDGELADLLNTMKG